MGFGFGLGILPDLGSQLHASAMAPTPTPAANGQTATISGGDVSNALGKLGIKVPGMTPPSSGGGYTSDLGQVRTGLPAFAQSAGSDGGSILSTLAAMFGG